MGKGDDRRPTLVSEQQFATSWCETMGHKMYPSKDWCLNCGKSAEQIARETA